MHRTLLAGLVLGSSLLAWSAAAPGQVPAGYSLEQDRNQRIELAKQELGPKTKPRVVEEVFVVIGSGEAVGLMERATAAYFNGRFDKRPDQAISVYLFPNAKQYDAYCQKQLGAPCISVYGFYRPDLRRIVMNAEPGLGTLTHELVHPIIDTDFPQAPTWLNEGIASLYEAPVMPRAGEIHGRKNWRHPRLLQALASKDERQLVTLERLFALSDAEFRGAHEDLNYALARYFCQWLDAQDELWPFYRGWRDGYADDTRGVKSFVGVTTLRRPDEARDAVPT